MNQLPIGYMPLLPSMKFWFAVAKSTLRAAGGSYAPCCTRSTAFCMAPPANSGSEKLTVPS